MDYSFTSKIEDDFDKIAKGEIDWTENLRKFYEHFHPQVEAVETVSRQEIGGMRELGQDPDDGKTIYARLGRYGPMLQKGLAEDSEEKPVFSPLPPGTTLESVILEEALRMFQLPRLAGQTEAGEEIWAKTGRFGPYLQVEKLFVPLKEDDPFTIEEARARELVTTKRDEEKNKLIADFDAIKIINGRFGPYMTDGSKNCKLPRKDDSGKEIDPRRVSREQAEEWFKQHAKKPSGKRRKRA